MSVLQVDVDVEDLLVHLVLRPNDDIQSKFGASVIRVYKGEIPAKPVYPLLTVQRLGGSLQFSHHLWCDSARVQYDVWSDQKPPNGQGFRKDTQRMAGMVRSLFIACQGTTYAPAGRIDGVTELIAPISVPDDNGRYHFVGEMQVNVRPIAVTT